MEEISEPQLVQQDNSFLRSEEISLDEFQDAITSCENDLQLVAFLRNKYDLSPMFILQSLRRAVASNKLDLMNHALRLNDLLPPDSLLRSDDDHILQLLQKAVSMEEMEAFQALLPHIRNPNRANTKMELQCLAILAAQFGSILAVRLLCMNYPACLKQTMQGRSVFLEAARSAGSSLQSVLADMIEMGVNVNTQEPDGNTVLHISAEKSNVEAIKLLLSHNACSSLRNAQGKMAMHLGKTQEVTALLKKAALSQLPHEASLYHAAEQPELKWFERLLKEGVPVDSKWIHGRTALAAAAKVGNMEMVRFILSSGAAPIPLGSYWPELPIALALVYRHTDIAIKLMNSTEEYHVRATDIEKKHIKAQLVYLLHYCAQIGAADLTNLILKSRYRIDPNTEFRDQLAPIHVASKYGQLSVVKTLLLNNTRPDLPSEVYCNTPLHYACFYGQTEVASFLNTQRKVSVNCKNILHETPLFCVLRCVLTPHEKSSFIQEGSIIFLISNGASLIKPGRQNCELKEFNLDVAAHRWPFVPVQTQKLILVLRDEGRCISLASEVRYTIRASLQDAITEDLVSELGLPFRLQKYVLLKDWFPT